MAAAAYRMSAKSLYKDLARVSQNRVREEPVEPKGRSAKGPP